MSSHCLLSLDIIIVSSPLVWFLLVPIHLIVTAEVKPRFSVLVQLSYVQLAETSSGWKACEHQVEYGEDYQNYH